MMRKGAAAIYLRTPSHYELTAQFAVNEDQRIN
jgi:hypothetical protein